MDNKEEGIILNSEDSGETLEVAHFTGRSKQRLKQGLSIRDDFTSPEDRW